ncbi:MAG: gamma carbonic anhydrase family protein [Desulfurispora sp.]|uniref:gamma carbonic anhydrase family protein n=1 Tax=Desulfurispora sp. TaxID=3014275 RepID=UPI004049436A
MPDNLFSNLYAFGDHYPRLEHPVYIAPGARIIGRVTLGKGASIWYNTVVRADVDTVTIGSKANIQDNCTLHEDPGFPLVIGEKVSVGHGAVLHGCTIHDLALIGMGAVVLNGAVVGRGAVLAAGSVLPPGKQIPDGHMAMGSPARVVRALSAEEQLFFQQMALRYYQRAMFCLGLTDYPEY